MSTLRLASRLPKSLPIGATKASGPWIHRSFVAASPTLAKDKDNDATQSVKEAAEAVKKGAKSVEKTSEFVRDTVSSTAESVTKLTKDVTGKITEKAAELIKDKVAGK
ncbi:hypothetical protein Tsubulata_006900 [Turnera subulata]|uniref:Uncharacterized protein n=1 Tax=Turnera subulata TaxID=218843 RepID=A0A9Q0GI09_9ROSI|nr:hypothetical protein Tsubulata_006900 [Turnera subulata]